MKFYWSGHRGHGRWTMSLICPCPRQITRTLSDDNHMLGHMADADVGQCPNMSTSAIYGADIENVQHWSLVVKVKGGGRKYRYCS